MDSNLQNSASNRNNEDAESSCQREMEKLAYGVSEMVLKSPTSKSSKLSANAPEFVPSWMKSENSSSPSSNVPNAAGAADVVDINNLSETDINRYLMADIQMYLSHLQSNPASFNDMAGTILDLLFNFAYDANVLTAVVDQIFRTGMEWENFTYQCARLCAFLAENYWNYNPTSDEAEASAVDNRILPFRDVLLDRCCTEHQSILAGPLPNVYKYALLLADLYNQLKMNDKNVKILGNAVLEIVDGLLKDPDNGNVACAVRVLKVCGATLEACERGEYGQGEEPKTPKLDALIAKFESLLQSPTEYNLSEEAKALIRNLLSNRGEWKKYANPPADYDNEQPIPFHRVSSEMVYFGPDGEELTAEETAFLERELGALQSSSDEEAIFMASNNEDDIIDQCYEEFLKMTEEKKKQKK